MKNKFIIMTGVMSIAHGAIAAAMGLTIMQSCILLFCGMIAGMGLWNINK